jgi:hypothetical protein
MTQSQRPEPDRTGSGPPDPGTPEVGTPEPGTPEVGTPEPGTPEVGTPRPGTPEVGTPGPGTPEPDLVRAEAERLVAAGLAALSMAADRIGAPTRERGGAAAAGYEALGDMLFGPSAHRRHSVANDSPACCRCPVCRAIAAARDPDPEVAEKLATGVGMLAEGAARLLRGVAGAWPPPAARPEPAPQPEPEPRPAATAEPRPAPDPDLDPWAAATAEPDPGPGPG